jgi:hypothetical protein
MSEYRTFQSGQILTDAEQRELSPEDRKRYKTEQRIRAAIKLAESPGATEDEKIQATRTIARLMALFEIDMDALADKDDAKKPIEIVEFDWDVSNRLGLGDQRISVINRAVVLPLGGRMVYNSSRWADTPATANIFLPDDMVAFAKVLMASLLLQVETSMKVATAQHRRELMADRYVTKSDMTRMINEFRKGYLLAWADTVGRRVREGREEARQEASISMGKEVALRDPSALSRAAVEARYPKTRKARAVRVSDTGRTAGRRDGRTASIGGTAITK